MVSFGTSTNATSKIPFLGDDDIVHYRLSEEQEKDPVYIPMACFITAYARDKTIRTSQAITDFTLKKYGKDMYIYSDTDSIHTMCPIEDLKQFCQIDPVKLGCWDHEGFATKAKFIRQKCYIENIVKDESEKMKITCAGLPKNCYDKVTWDNFKVGLSVPRKAYI